MADSKTTRLELSYSESKVTHMGAVEMEIVGHTVGGKTHRIVLVMGPSSLGYLADTLHSATKKYQEELDAVKRSLRGE